MNSDIDADKIFGRRLKGVLCDGDGAGEVTV
jgi:hypothetical protein